MKIYHPEMDLEKSLAYEELLKNHQRDINCLVDDVIIFINVEEQMTSSSILKLYFFFLDLKDRNLRKKGLTTILKTVLSAPTPAKEALQFF